MRHFYLFIMIFLLTGCQFMTFQDFLVINLPEHESQIFEEHQFSWLLLYRDDEGFLQKKDIDADVEKLYLTVSRGRTRAYLIFGKLLISSNEVFLTKPAGFIYPYSTREKTKPAFQWEEGFESLLFNKIDEYINLENLNISRILKTIDAVSENDSHWIIDGLLMEEQLLAGDFNVYDIRRLRKREIGLNLPEGEWFNSNILGNNVLSVSFGDEVLLEVPTGNSRYLHQSGLQLEIDVKENGTFEYIVY